MAAVCSRILSLVEDFQNIIKPFIELQFYCICISVGIYSLENFIFSNGLSRMLLHLSMHQICLQLFQQNYKATFEKLFLFFETTMSKLFSKCLSQLPLVHACRSSLKRLQMNIICGAIIKVEMFTLYSVPSKSGIAWKLYQLEYMFEAFYVVQLMSNQ